MKPHLHVSKHHPTSRPPRSPRDNASPGSPELHLCAAAVAGFNFGVALGFSNCAASYCAASGSDDVASFAGIATVIDDAFRVAVAEPVGDRASRAASHRLPGRLWRQRRQRRPLGHRYVRRDGFGCHMKRNKGPKDGEGMCVADVNATLCRGVGGGYSIFMHDHRPSP